MAQLTSAEKNKISHRAEALKKLSKRLIHKGSVCNESADNK